MDIATYRRIVRLLKRMPAAVRTRAEPTVAGWAMRRVPDRRYLEGHVLPTLASLRLSRLLFVGTSRVPDTRSYHRSYRWRDTEFWTMDSSPDASRWGSDRHVCGDICAASEYFAPGSFDCLVLNGVFGWGVDTPEAQDRAIIQCRLISRHGGLLVLGWNRGRCRDPLDLPAVCRLYLPHPLGGAAPRVEFRGTDHVFDILVVNGVDATRSGLT